MIDTREIAAYIKQFLAKRQIEASSREAYEPTNSLWKRLHFDTKYVGAEKDVEARVAAVTAAETELEALLDSLSECLVPQPAKDPAHFIGPEPRPDIRSSFEVQIKCFGVDAEHAEEVWKKHKDLVAQRQQEPTPRAKP